MSGLCCQTVNQSLIQTHRHSPIITSEILSPVAYRRGTLESESPNKHIFLLLLPSQTSTTKTKLQPP